MLVKMKPRWGKLNPWLSSPAKGWVPTDDNPNQRGWLFLWGAKEHAVLIQHGMGQGIPPSGRGQHGAGPLEHGLEEDTGIRAPGQL